LIFVATLLNPAMVILLKSLPLGKYCPNKLKWTPESRQSFRLWGATGEYG